MMLTDTFTIYIHYLHGKSEREKLRSECNGSANIEFNDSVGTTVGNFEFQHPFQSETNGTNINQVKFQPKVSFNERNSEKGLSIDMENT